MRHQVQDHFGIAVGLKNGSAALQVPPQFAGVGDIAIVRHRNAALMRSHRERLRIQQRSIARG